MTPSVKISDFKKVHAGKRLFILASGPSLSTFDLEPLHRRIVMGLNRSFLLFPDTHYNCTMDHRLFELFPGPLRKTRYLLTLEDRPWGIPIKLLGAEGFSLDLEKGIYSGYTVSYFALQVAVYMGFSEIVYLGLDLKHSNGNTHFFGSDYHSQSHEQIEFPKMLRMIEYGAQTLADAGVKLFNCSPVSNLKGFHHVTYDYAISL